MPYINLGYKPKKSDFICRFYVEPKKELMHDLEQVPAESSIGTWTDISTMKPRVVKQLQAQIFRIKKLSKKKNTPAIIDVAYPLDSFEMGSVPQILSSMAGNIFGMKAVKNLRLLDMRFPKEFIKSMPGPKYGISGIRKLLRVRKRPLVGTIVKPKIGLSAAEHAKVAYEAWVGGCDVVKDDENLTSQKFNPFNRRIRLTLKARDKAEKETGEKKVYMANITAETEEMMKRARIVKDYGGEYIMIDIFTTGFAALQTMRKRNYNQVIHAHRAMHAAITRQKKHGITMLTFAKLFRLIGVDQLHIGTGVGKMCEPPVEVIANATACRDRNTPESKDYLGQNWYGMRRVFPVSSGGMHPGLVPANMKFMGNDVIIQMGGGIHGHPKGTRAGARAARQAVDAVMKGYTLKEYAKKHEELALALKKWGKRSTG